jgi:nucleotide sugar dehydrogenase
MKTSTANQSRTRKGTDSLSLLPEDIGPLLRSHELRICIIGLGRIGLPTAAVFAEAGARVTGLDIDESIVKQTNAGQCRLLDEPGLEEVVTRTVKENNLSATTDPEAAIPSSHFIVVCVPTPVDANKSPNYDAVRRVSETVGKFLSKGSIVIVESTVGPGVVEDLVGSTIERESGLKQGVDFGLASCPERSDPGSIMKNMHAVPRIVGCTDGNTADLVAALYKEGLNVPVVKVSNPKTANAVKLTENLFRDVNIALANEFALLYEEFGIDTVEVINACATKYNFMPHYPGAGVGGPCLPSNSYYLIMEGIRVGNIPYLIRLAREINDRMPDHMVELTSEALNEVGKTIRGSKIAVLGIAYKPGVRDIQHSPVDRIIARLVGMGAKVEAYDPMYAGETVMGVAVRESAEQAVTGSDCIVVGTAHDEFKRLSLDQLSKLANTKAALVDGRSVFEPAEARRVGFAFRGVGRANSG